ncbi:MAG: hypothetical protein H0S78_10630, partial [Tissierellales bacterium]|nr:hypothetical protein [Tissierellales bacterium]
ITDKERDRYLNKFGVKTIRINTHDINNKTKVLKEKMKSIKIYLDKNGSNLKNYKEAYNKKICIEPGKSEIFYKAATVIRFQILILSLLEKGKLKLDNDIWNLSVIERDISNFEELAIEDLFIWLKHLCKLNKLDFNKPKINLKIVKGEYLFYSNDYINIDFSLFQRWTDENKLKQNKEYIYIRTDYIDNCTHFRVSTHELIKYNINIVDESYDKESLLFLLKNIFEFEKFNLGQLPAIINSLEGNDTIGLLPTGGGKSLIYQFVGLLQPSINFVVAPIKSLMKDQMVNLDKKYITNTNYIITAKAIIDTTRPFL